MSPTKKTTQNNRKPNEMEEEQHIIPKLNCYPYSGKNITLENSHFRA